MQDIKSFLYLDEYKMYSISSQIFQGLTEYSLDYHGTKDEEEERQSGPLGSGRVIASILKSESSIEAKRYLHDYSYTLFEQHLNAQKKVQVIRGDNIGEVIACLDSLAFVEIRAKAVFNDMNSLNSTIGSFNQLGEALAYVGSFEELSNARQQLATLADSTTDRNEKARLRQRLKALSDVEKLATSKGMRQDPKYLEKIAFLLEYGFQDQFEVRMATGPYAFSANLKREYLREDEHLLIRKYSRISDKTFVLFGTIAQGLTNLEENADEDASVEDAAPEHLKEAVMAIVEALSGLEQSFSGKLENEIIIDPIALYREI